MTHQPCPRCGGRLPTYRLQAPTGQAWNSFLYAWLAGFGTEPVSTAQLVALAASHTLLPAERPAVFLGQMLALLAKADAGLEQYAVRFHSRGKGKSKPAKWRLAHR